MCLITDLITISVEFRFVYILNNLCYCTVILKGIAICFEQSSQETTINPVLVPRM